MNMITTNKPFKTNMNSDEFMFLASMVENEQLQDVIYNVLTDNRILMNDDIDDVNISKNGVRIDDNHVVFNAFDSENELEKFTVLMHDGSYEVIESEFTVIPIKITDDDLNKLNDYEFNLDYYKDYGSFNQYAYLFK